VKHVKNSGFQESNANPEESNANPEKEKFLREVINTQQQQIQTLIDVVKEIKSTSSTTNNTNCNNTINNTNTISVNVYLNDHCKDALNYTEFIKNMHFQLTDFLYKSNNGLIKNGLEQAVTKAIMDLPTNERPIHVTDHNRGNFYIKVKDKETEEEEWKINDSNGKDIACLAGGVRGEAIYQTYKRNHEGVDKNKGHDKQAKITTLLADKASDKNKKLIKHLAQNLPNIKDDIKELDV